MGRTKLNLVSPFAALLCLFVFTTACTKKTETAHLKMNFGDWSAIRSASIARQSKVSSLVYDAETVGTVIINVSGAGINPPILTHWSRHSQPNPQTAMAPTYFDIPNVPKGSGRLIQVLAVYEGSGMEFHYGEIKKDLSKDLDSADVTLTLQGGTQAQGDIVGRIVPPVEPGYTGTFQFRFLPPSGTQPMVVEIGEMFDGWTHMFALGSPLISYVKPDGTPILAGMGALSDSLHSLSMSQTSMRVRKPVYYENKNWNGGYDFSDGQQGERVLDVGFFGARSATMKVCFDSPVDIPTALPIQGLYSDTTGPTPMKWIGNLGPSAVHAYNDQIQTPSPFYGGATSCSGSTEFVDYFNFRAQQLAHSDSVVGFKGPFRYFSESNGYYQFVDLTDAGSGNFTVSWKILPGNVRASINPNLTVFYREVTTGQPNDTESLKGNTSMDGFDCAGFKNSSYGFHWVDVPTASADGSGTATIGASAPLGFSITQPDKLQAVVCPKDLQGNYYSSAVVGAAQSTGGGQQVRFKLINVDAPGQNVTSQFTCTQYKVAAENSDGSVHVVPSGKTASLEVNLSQGTGPVFYLNATDCAGPTNPQSNIAATIAAAQSQSNSFWIRTGAGGDFRMRADATGGDYTSANSQGDEYALSAFPSSPMYNGFQVMAMDRMALTMCYRVTISATYSSGGMNQLGGSMSPIVIDTLGVSGSGFAGTYYTSHDCSTGSTSSVTIPAYTSSVDLYFRPTAVPTANPGMLTAAKTSPAYNGSMNVYVGPNALGGFGVSGMMGPMQFDASTPCVQVGIKPLNSVGAEIVLNTSVTATINAASGGNLYSNATCTSITTGVPLTVQAGSNQSSGSVYVGRAAGQPYVQLSAFVSPSTYTSPELRVFAKAPPKYRLIYEDGNVVTKLISGFCYPVHVQALDDFGNAMTTLAPVTVSLGPMGSPIQFSTNNTCTGLVSSGSTTIAVGASEGFGQLYMTVPSGYGPNMCSLQIQGPPTGTGSNSSGVSCDVVDVAHAQTSQTGSTMTISLLNSGSLPILPPHQMTFTVTIGGSCTFTDSSTVRNFTVPMDGTSTFVVTDAISGSPCSASAVLLENLAKPSVGFMTGPVFSQ